MSSSVANTMGSQLGVWQSYIQANDANNQRAVSFSELHVAIVLNNWPGSTTAKLISSVSQCSAHTVQLPLITGRLGVK